MTSRDAMTVTVAVDLDRGNPVDRFIDDALHRSGFIGAIAYFLTVELGADRLHELIAEAEDGSTRKADRVRGGGR
jgi:hypothetical protein